MKAFNGYDDMTTAGRWEFSETKDTYTFKVIPQTGQVTQRELIEKLTEYRKRTGTDFGNFRFEPGTGNWYHEKKGKEDDFGF